MLAIIVFSTVRLILELYWYFIIARILLSFFPDVLQMGIGSLVVRVTDPYLVPFRRMIPPLQIGSIYLDVATIVAIIAYWFVQNGILFLLGLLIG